MNEYTITPKDIDAYLATLTPGQITGVTRSGAHCPVAIAFHRKYPHTRGLNVLGTNMRFRTTDNGPEVCIQLPEAITAFIRKFDTINNDSRRSRVTKKRVVRLRDELWQATA